MEVPRAMILKSRLKILIKYKGNGGAAGEILKYRLKILVNYKEN